MRYYNYKHHTLMDLSCIGNPLSKTNLKKMLVWQMGLTPTIYEFENMHFDKYVYYLAKIAQMELMEEDC